MAIGLLTKRNKEINKVVLLPVAEIFSNPSQPRKHFDPDSLQELCHSIAFSGLLQPITVRSSVGGGYELIAGERRVMAFRILGREHIPAIVEEFSDEQSAILALVENLQRKDLNYFEEAEGIKRLMQELSLSQQQISQKLGKAQSTVANKLRLLRYAPDLRDRMLELKLSERHARALLKLVDPEKQTRAVDYVAKNALNVEQTERYVQALLEQAHKKPMKRVIVKDMRLFINSINRAVNMMKAAGINVDARRREDGEYLEYTLKVPKSSVYREG